jgi:hypothetical protein
MFVIFWDILLITNVSQIMMLQHPLENDNLANSHSRTINNKRYSPNLCVLRLQPSNASGNANPLRPHAQEASTDHLPTEHEIGNPLRIRHPPNSRGNASIYELVERCFDGVLLVRMIEQPKLPFWTVS